ncbi:MAG: branched-chain amino acid ABC transporter permease [Syntrophaceae bacterium]|jgi:branched-chain amino acid transport system permease protein|nr:branched-chain amino acid ABC transporter permease [Syntrophaceae bacterium]
MAEQKIPTGPFPVLPLGKGIVARDMVLIGASFVLLALIIPLHWVIDFTIFCILVLSFDLLYGFMGRLSFGHVLYYGTGAYIASLMLLHVSRNPFLAIAAGVGVGAVLAVVLGFVVLQTDGAPFALINLAFNQIGFWLAASGLQKFTKGEDGLNTPVGKWGFLDFANQPLAFGFLLICLLAVFLLLRVLTLSPYGITIRSIKENDDRVKFLGYNIFAYKWLTFVLSSTLAAFPGTLFALFYGFVAPTIISPFGNVEVIFAVLIGGAGNLYGAIAGGVVYKLMSNYLATNITRWEMVLGVLLLIWVFKFRRGLTGYASELVLRLRQRPAAEV